MIRISRLTKQYRDAPTRALDDVSLDIGKGIVFGLLGPNGAGKTTLISILTGMLGKDSGRVEVGGIEIDGNVAAVRRLIGYVPQDLAFYPSLTVGENLRLFASLSTEGPIRQLDFAVDTAQLGEHLRKTAGTLSGGLKRRLNLAIGLLGQPQLLCLDEPTAGVDPQSRHFLIETIQRLRDQGITILYTTHYMDEVERVCERLAILDHGRVIAEGSIGDLLARTGGNLESLFLQLTDVRLRDEA